MENKFISKSTGETENIGRDIANMCIETYRALGHNMYIALYGDVGVGKTVLVRGIASVLSPGSKVRSPSYTIVREYRNGIRPLFHFDLYRLGNIDELQDIGYDEYLEKGDCVIEWSEKLGTFMPDEAIKVFMKKIDDNTREIDVRVFN